MSTPKQTLREIILSLRDYAELEGKNAVERRLIEAIKTTVDSAAKTLKVHPANVGTSFENRGCPGCGSACGIKGCVICEERMLCDRCKKAGKQ